MEVNKNGEEGSKVCGENQQQCSSNLKQNPESRKGKSCKGTLYFSSILKSKGKNPRCVGFTRSLQQVPNYIVSESEVEASKEGRSLTDFRYACVGYSVYLDNKGTPPTSDQKPRAELPVCVGLELLVDKRPADHTAPAHAPAHAHSREDDRVIPQTRPPKTPHVMGEEFLTRFTRNAGLVASGVARNMRKVGHYIKESVDDILYKRPK
ncbi:hypothetical protein RND81_13G212400 [Saponaria officinalis]|uniref:DUF8204 domain-containing protein n=1 Tax=Saponaria officinalis TaxID=3572 RepID=A0AAW1H5S4_SAPOF